MSDTLTSGQSLVRGTPNDTLVSANGQYTLSMQQDGNLVIYKGGTAIWATNTAGTDGQTAIMQADGNFVLYRVNGQPLWASNTEGNPNSWVIMQDDGNLVVYHPVPLWASNTVNG